MNLVTPQLTALVFGLAGIVGASVAVCLGHIDTSTYVAIVGPVLGVGVGAGVHASGTTTGATVSNSNGTSPSA